jgi:LysM repeat protein
MLQRFLLILFVSAISTNNVKTEEAFYPEPSFFTQDDDFFLHTIERGQTVYSIASMYNVSVDDIHALNPESKDGIKAGSSLKIPQKSGSYLFHTIQSKETLYSVSRKYQMKGEDILSVNPGLSIETFTVGKIIRIPTNTVTNPAEGNDEDLRRKTESLLKPVFAGENIDKVKVALLLPFGLQEGTTPSNASKNRMVEYYEGFLIALDDLKKKGISVQLQVYDIGSKTDVVSKLLKKKEMQDIHVLVGGLSDEQIKLLSAFASKNEIPYVIPFTSKSDEPLNNYHVYQINTPQSYLFSKTSTAFCKKYKNSNIIFYNSSKDSDKSDLIKNIKSDLDAQNIPYQTISSLENLRSVISDKKNNVFIPSDDTEKTLIKLAAALKTVIESRPKVSISMFGYPSWQVYMTGHVADFFSLNVNFYTVYYADPTSPAVKSFHNKYHRWYSRNLINRYPKYGILGYDTGMFFIQLLYKYGTSYDVNINKSKYEGVQTDFHFERINNWGGFINTNIYFVEFDADSRINTKRID